MESVLIQTEDPQADTWRRIARFNYPENVVRFLAAHGRSATVDGLIDFVAGCFRQAEAYFAAAKNAPLDIAPLLSYYGATSLLSGAGALLTGAIPPTKRHGMLIGNGAGSRIADTLVIPENMVGSGLRYFCAVFSGGHELGGGAKWQWTVEEILASIPDLRPDFESCYQGSEPYTMQVVVVQKDRNRVERVYQSELAKHPNPANVFDRILDLKSAYLPIDAFDSSDYLSLHPRHGGDDIGVYTTLGQKHLPLAHPKATKLVSPDQIILMLMGMFALGYLSRYQPQKWNPFVRRDETGERLVVEQFLAICQRYFPNLVLNRIEGRRLQFVHEIEKPVDLRSVLTEKDKAEIKKLVHQMIEDDKEEDGLNG